MDATNFFSNLHDTLLGSKNQTFGGVTVVFSWVIYLYNAYDSTGVVMLFTWTGLINTVIGNAVVLVMLFMGLLTKAIYKKVEPDLLKLWDKFYSIFKKPIKNGKGKSNQRRA